MLGWSLRAIVEMLDRIGWTDIVQDGSPCDAGDMCCPDFLCIGLMAEKEFTGERGNVMQTLALRSVTGSEVGP